MHVHSVFDACTPRLPRYGLAKQKSNVDFEKHSFLNFLINNVIYRHFSHHYHFIPLQIKGALLLSHVDDVNIKVI